METSQPLGGHIVEILGKLQANALTVPIDHTVSLHLLRSTSSSYIEHAFLACGALTLKVVANQRQRAGRSARRAAALNQPAAPRVPAHGLGWTETLQRLQHPESGAQ